MSLGKLVALIFAGIFGLSVLIVILSTLVNSQRDSKSMANQSNSISAPSSPTVNKNSPDYQSGFKKGTQMGKDIAKTPGGMPLPVGIRGMGNIQIQEAKPADENAWRSGFEDGFRKGFESIRGVSARKDKDYEQLSWSNAKPNVKLYGYDEKHEATIVSVNQSSGLITVKYVKARGSVVEDKKLDAVSQFWWVRKNDPALKL